MKQKELFTEKNIVRSMYDKTERPTGNIGLVAILKPSRLVGEFAKPEYQLFRLETGFGCFPTTSGNACYGYFCADGEKCRMERYDFIGIANEATTQIAEELEAQHGRKAG